MMLRKLITVFILVPLALVIVAFALANRELVTVSFDPFNSADPAFVIRMPLFVLVFALTMLGVVVGGVAAWLRQSKWRRTARKLDGDIVALRREIELLGRRLQAQSGRLEAARISYTPPAA